ncbi:glutaredoxin domain-containing cysteine-rich protein 2 [Brienomyrus brachyistius]|uniref:glutaredoxin domain-containing cysteine-rich protein 2 n=1 Tax=Brienomyrus brachyistius TaxID=42636 RepID=UPI0020B40EFF|nr:glutaredoxin domain-containing cysteine-rich protein 2 [Brienomyrus brachyistius]
MEDPQRKLSQRYDGKPRKVRFKIASSYSGRVLKHVYEDGQELDSPEEKYPRSFMHGKVPQHLEEEQLSSFQEAPEARLGSSPGLTAQRINVYRGMTSYRLATCGGSSPADSRSSVLDFGKIIIYTSNLRIIRCPQRRTELMKTSVQRQDEEGEDPHGRGRGGKHCHGSRCDHWEDEDGLETAEKEEAVCPQCGGSGCTPCSLCHGSKLSMLANRFNESIRALRCPACYPDGLQRCQSCSGRHGGEP